MKDLNQGLFGFIAKSPTCFQAVETSAEMLEQAGFEKLTEASAWELKAGNGYYVTRNQSSLIAFRMPERLESCMIGAAHTDSPCFRLKDNATVAAEGYSKLDANKYGGMIFSTWLDRPLSVAGRILVSTGKGVESRLVDLDQDLMVIPSLAIHMDRTTNDGKRLTAQTDLMPLLGKGNLDILALAAEKAGVQKEQILSHDLFVYNRERGTRLGPQGELILCPRLDDLQCVYGLLEGFLGQRSPMQMPVLCLFDNEEIGSSTAQGAMSTFLQDVLLRVCATQGMGKTEYLRLLAGSMMVSADNAHGVHPNHPEKAALTNRPKLGEGVAVKYGTGYATTGVSAALLLDILRKKNIPVQSYFNHSDVAGGSTLGALSVTQVSVRTVDIGLAQLAMHSANETAGAADIGYLVSAMEAFFGASIHEQTDGSYLVDID